MNKLFLITLGLVAATGLQADTFHDAVAELEAVGKRPSCTLQDIEDFKQAARKVDQVMAETDPEVIQCWINEQVTVLSKKGYAKPDYSAMDTVENAARLVFSGNKSARAFYHTEIAPKFEQLVQWDDKTINQALAYYKASFLDLPEDIKSILRSWCMAIALEAEAQPRVLDILAALDGTLETACKRIFFDDFSDPAHLKRFITIYFFGDTLFDETPGE